MAGGGWEGAPMRSGGAKRDAEKSGLEGHVEGSVDKVGTCGLGVLVVCALWDCGNSGCAVAHLHRHMYLLRYLPSCIQVPISHYLKCGWPIRYQRDNCTVI